MKKVLVVEDSPIVMKVLKHVLSGSELFEFDYVTSMADAKAKCEAPGAEYFAGLIDLTLPDAPDGEVVDYCLSRGIPSVVLTGSFDEEKKNKLLAKGIVDYVTKEGRFSYEYALGVLERLVKNQSLKVLVVDDSDTARHFVSALLRLQLFQVFEAKDGAQAIKLLLENPDIKLMITDFNMPRMDGCELVKNIRLKYEKADLIIIGISSDTSGSLSARFIKSGANDFLRKPFNHEEFYCRINHDVEFLELIESIRDSSYRDDLTGAYNRKYFYSRCEQAFIDRETTGAPISIAVIELEEFLEVNERFGYDMGDEVMKSVVVEFDAFFGRFVLARSKGLEFYVLMPGLDNEKATAYVEKARQIFGSADLGTDDCRVNLTFSAGVSSVASNDYPDLIRSAFENLRRARDAGGDLVFGD